MNIDIDGLIELAKKATPGPWWIDSHGHSMVSEIDHKLIFATNDNMGKATRHAETGNLSHWPNDWDATFIANANPAVILALCERLREAENHNERKALQAEVERLRKRLEIEDGSQFDGIYCRDETIKGQDELIRSLKVELAEAVELLKVSTALLECNAQPIDKPSIEANTAFLARHGDKS